MQQLSKLVSRDLDPILVYHDGENAAIPHRKRGSNLLGLLRHSLHQLGLSSYPIEMYIAIGRPDRMKEVDRDFFNKMKGEEKKNVLLPDSITYKLVKKRDTQIPGNQAVDHWLNNLMGERIIFRERVVKAAERDGVEAPPGPKIMLIGGDRGYLPRIERFLELGCSVYIVMPEYSTAKELQSLGTSCLWSSIWEKRKNAWYDWTSHRQLADDFERLLTQQPVEESNWIGYAKHEEGRRDELAKQIYVRALDIFTYSVEIWLHYCTHMTRMYDSDPDADPEPTRNVFEQALLHVGDHYLSSRIWECYINYEKSRNNWSKVATIYTNQFKYPIQNLQTAFNRFKELTKKHELQELITPEEAGVNVKDYLDARRVMYDHSKALELELIGFENVINDPSSSEEKLLQNWRKYLDWIERTNDVTKVAKLYERCVLALYGTSVPWSEYAEIWIRYVRNMESSQRMEHAEHALYRATFLYVPQDLIQEFAAEFRKRNPIPDAAGAAL